MSANDDRAAAIDLSRAPRGELAAAQLVTAVADTGDLAERHYLELKGPPDLATKVNKAKVAKFILGAANRLPDRAAEAFEGYGVMIVGITKQGIEGVPPIEMLPLSQVISRFSAPPALTGTSCASRWKARRTRSWSSSSTHHG